MKILEMMRQHNYDYSDLHPYVFSPLDAPISEVNFDDAGVPASPFEAFSVEVDGKYITYDPSPMGVNVVCYFCRELSYDKFEFVALQEMMGKPYILRVSENELTVYRGNELVSYQGRDAQMYDFLRTLTYQYMRRLQSSHLGTFNAAGKAKFKTSSGQKAFFKPNDVIYVRDRAYSEAQVAKQGRTIHWKNTWEVSSHWRKISPDSLGVGRDGVRDVRGATFIQTYSKGMGELKVKTRKVVVK